MWKFKILSFTHEGAGGILLRAIFYNDFHKNVGSELLTLTDCRTTTDIAEKLEKVRAYLDLKPTGPRTALVQALTIF